MSFDDSGNTYKLNRDPLVTDDYSSNYVEGDYIENTSANPVRLWRCTDGSIGAAVWIDVTKSIAENIIYRSSAPTVDDDQTEGNFIGQRWIHEVDNADKSKNIAYICLDDADGEAFWYPIASAGIVVGPGGEIIFEAPVIFESGVAFNSVFVTPVLTSNQDDYNIPNIGTYTTIIWRSSVNITVSGLNATGISDWLATIYVNGNTSNKWIQFVMDDPGSALVNRYTGDANIRLRSGDFWWFLRNVSLSRWIAQAKI
jgi:hypothetical protein